MERLVPHAPGQARSRAARLAGRAEDPRGDLQHGGCAGLRRLLHLAPEPCRSRHGGLPGSARQCHRPDHDRDRRPGLAPDDLPSLRPFQPDGTRPGSAHPDRLAHLCRALQRSQRADRRILPAARRALPQALGGARRQDGHAHLVRAEPQPQRRAAAHARCRRLQGPLGQAGLAALRPRPEGHQ